MCLYDQAPAAFRTLEKPQELEGALVGTEVGRCKEGIGMHNHAETGAGEVQGTDLLAAADLDIRAGVQPGKLVFNKRRVTLRAQHRDRKPCTQSCLYFLKKLERKLSGHAAFTDLRRGINDTDPGKTVT